MHSDSGTDTLPKEFYLRLDQFMSASVTVDEVFTDFMKGLSMKWECSHEAQ